MALTVTSLAQHGRRSRAATARSCHPRPVAACHCRVSAALGEPPVAQGSVTAPRSAPVTSRAYFARTPGR